MTVQGDDKQNRKKKTIHNSIEVHGIKQELQWNGIKRNYK